MEYDIFRFREGDRDRLRGFYGDRVLAINSVSRRLDCSLSLITEQREVKADIA